MENRNTMIVLGALLLGIAFLFMNQNKKEGYQQTELPYNGPGFVYPMQNDRFYDNIIKQNNVSDQNMNMCSNSINASQNNGGNIDFKNCCQKCMSSLKNQEANTRLYYNKFRKLQDKVANLENQLNFTQDVLREYKKRLTFCQREVTLEPTVAKCNRNYDLVPNSITGLGVETQFKQGTKY